MSEKQTVTITTQLKLINYSKEDAVAFQMASDVGSMQPHRTPRACPVV